MINIKEYVSGKEDNEIVVLKPVSASSGVGVIVSKKKDINYKEIDELCLNNNGYMGQDFIDTSAGIQDLTKDVHDLA